jgi:hypothetical protein
LGWDQLAEFFVEDYEIFETVSVDFADPAFVNKQ